jgi:hypothetical protein
LLILCVGKVNLFDAKRDEGESIGLNTEPSDHTRRDTGNHGFVPEFFA